MRRALHATVLLVVLTCAAASDSDAQSSPVRYRIGVLTTTFNGYGAILDVSARVPAVFRSAFWVRYGALVSYGPDYHAEGRQAARLVAAILRGKRPRDLPVEAPAQIELSVNLTTAKALGIDVPREILSQADHVIP